MTFYDECLLSFTEHIEKDMRELFEVSDDKEVRLWNKYMSNTYEQLNKPDNTVQDAGLYQGQVRIGLLSKLILVTIYTQLFFHSF